MLRRCIMRITIRLSHIGCNRETNRRRHRDTPWKLQGGWRRTISSDSRRKGQVYEENRTIERKGRRGGETYGETETERRRACKRTKERKRDVCTRACALWSPVGLPFNRWLDSPTHSFIHTRCTRFESISKPRKRIFPIGLATASLSAFLHGVLPVPFFLVNLSVQHIASDKVTTLFSRENNFSYIFVNSRAFSKSYYYVVLKLKKKLVFFDVVRNWLFNNFLVIFKSERIIHPSFGIVLPIRKKGRFGFRFSDISAIRWKSLSRFDSISLIIPSRSVGNSRLSTTTFLLYYTV